MEIIILLFVLVLLPCCVAPLVDNSEINEPEEIIPYDAQSDYEYHMQLLEQERNNPSFSDDELREYERQELRW